MSTYTVYELLGTVVRDDGVTVSPAQSVTDADFVAYQEWIALGNSPTIDSTTAMTLDDLKASRCQEVNDLREIRLTDTYTEASTGIVWDMDAEAIKNLSGVCTLIACGAVTSSQTWRDHNNVNHTLTPTQLVTLAGEFAVHSATCYGVSWTHKAAINALTTAADVLAYDITAYWP